MKKLLISTFALLFLGGCSFLAPYSITFTTPAQSAVHPLEDTLDLALSQEALAYVSGVDCEGADPIELLPIVNASMKSNKAHNLGLELLDGYEAGTECTVTVTVFDQTTTATTAASISLYVLEKPEIIEPVEEEEEASNELVEEILEEVIEVESLEEILEEDPTTEAASESALVEEGIPTENTQELCVADGGQWNNQCNADGLCEQWCEYVE